MHEMKRWRVAGGWMMITVAVWGWAAIGHGASLTWEGGSAGTWQDGGGGWRLGDVADTWDNATPDTALFTGAAPASVSIAAGGVTVADLTVSAGTYTFSGPGVLTLDASTLGIAAGLTATMQAGLAGADGFTKTGDGTLVLSGNNKTYGGTTVIEGGAVDVSAVGANVLGASASAAVTLDGGALHANFTANASPGWIFEVGAGGGEIRLLNSGRWQMNQANRFTGSGTLTLSFGSVNTRYELNAAQDSFAGSWVLSSAGNNNRFFDIYSGFTPGSGTGDDLFTLNQASLLLRNGVVLGGANQGLTLTGGTSRISVAGGSTATVAGKLSGGVADAVEFNLGNATSVLVLSNTNNSWQGDTVVRTDAASGDVRGTLRLGAAGVLPDTGGNLTLNTGLVLDLAGHDETIGGLLGGGRVISSSGAATLTVGANDNSPTFTGTLADGGGTLALNKVGAGIQSLVGTNTYTGATRIEQGTLKLNAGSSIATTPTLDIAAGAVLDVTALAPGLILLDGQTLRGEGEVNGALIVGAGATLAPGSSPGILTVDGLTLAGSGRLALDINGVAAPGMDYDRVVGSGTLTYQTGWVLEVSFGANLAGTHTVTVADFAGYSGTGNAPTIELAPGSAAGAIGFNAATGELTFTDATVIPEPGSALLIGLGGLLLAARRCH